MSNNKKSMKLYTEEQVTELTTAAFMAGQNHNPAIFGVAFEKITPIELPSDEEIDRISFETYRDCPNNPNEHPEWEYNKDFNAPRKRRAFNKGATWMRNKIQGGNK